jgi:hypothetical protein
VIRVTLYTKPGCDLCREVRDELDALAVEFPHTVDEISILDDTNLFERYRYLIPVAVIGTTRLVYPFSALDLKVALEEASPGGKPPG